MVKISDLVDNHEASWSKPTEQISSFPGYFPADNIFVQPDSTENYLVGFLENHPRNEPIWHSSAIDHGNGWCSIHEIF